MTALASSAELPHRQPLRLSEPVDRERADGAAQVRREPRHRGPYPPVRRAVASGPTAGSGPVTASGATRVTGTASTKTASTRSTSSRSASTRSASTASVTSGPGDPTALCCAVAHAATEVLRGIRPLAQLVRSVSPEVYEQVEARCYLSSAARERRGAPPTPVSRSRVRRARVVRVGPDAAEASVVIDDVDRVRAVALRVELHRGRWRAVVLEIG